MKIAVVTDVHYGPPLTYEGQCRAHSDQALEALERTLVHIEKHKPNLLINMGDLIRSETAEADVKRLTKVRALFEQITCPVIHMLGNHEIKCMQPEQSFGSQQLEDMQIVWIGLAKNEQHYLPEEQVDWLEKALAQGPSLLFSHCLIDNQDVSGNYFYETIEKHKTAPFFLENKATVQQIIQRNDVRLVVQAHLHYFHVSHLKGVHYITCPALADMICSQNETPEIYTLIEKTSVRSYCGPFAFAGIDL